MRGVMAVAVCALWPGTGAPAPISTATCPPRRATATAPSPPFARTPAEREASGDPRPSLQARHGDRAGYAARVRRVAEELVAARLLLPEDAERLAAAAASGDPF